MSEKNAANSDQTPKVVGKPFQKGQSGNPSGRPKTPPEFTELAKSKSIPALMTLIDIMENMKNKPQDRIKSAEIVMAYGIGKPQQQIDLSNSDGSFKVTVEYVDDGNK